MNYFVLGESLPHTMSPEIHKQFGSDYGVKEVAKDELKDFVLSKKYCGFNVTVPYKVAIIDLIDDVLGDAKEIGAINTVVNRDGKLYGYNTDIGGMVYALYMAGIDCKNKSVAILGTGGTSNTAFYAAKKLGAKTVFKVGRTSPINYENIYGLEINLIINTTPIGTFPDSDNCLVEIERIKGLESVFDVVYNPLETELIRRAKKLGLKTGNGLRMLVEQARLAENLFFDREIPQTETERVLQKLYKEKKNIVLIGMPSSGKSSLAKIIAKTLNRELIDLDSEIVKEAGMEIPEIFEKFGEKYFRDLEEKIAVKFSSKFGAVIATGGGTVMREKSFNALTRNGTLFYIKRDLQSLDSDGRPVSKLKGVEQIYLERKSTYEKAHYTVQNIRKLESVAKEIIDIYEKNTRY